MQLREHEQILQEIRRHTTPFILSILKLTAASFPFYVVAYFIGKAVSTSFLAISFLVISLFVGFFLVYIFITYFFDKLIITNQRIIFVNWESLWRRDESSMNLRDIQDIRTRGKGILAKLRFLNYGLLEIETAASKTCITFSQAPHPEAIKASVMRLTHKSGAAEPEKEM